MLGDRLAVLTLADQSHNIRHDLGCGDPFLAAPRKKFMERKWMVAGSLALKTTRSITWRGLIKESRSLSFVTTFAFVQMNLFFWGVAWVVGKYVHNQKKINTSKIYSAPFSWEDWPSRVMMFLSSPTPANPFCRRGLPMGAIRGHQCGSHSTAAWLLCLSANAQWGELSNFVLSEPNSQYAKGNGFNFSRIFIHSSMLQLESFSLSSQSR